MSSDDRHLLTVVIPNYNYGSYIGEAVDSVLAQDYEPVELIVVDDGSSDESVAVVRERLAARDGRLHRATVMPLEENRGKLGAINAALPLIGGRYLIVLDADDWLDPGYARRCITELRERRLRDPELGFIYTDCRLVDRRGATIDRGRSAAFDRELVGRLSFLPEPALMLAEAFLQAAPFDESIRVATKHHKWRRVVANGWTGHHIAEPLFSYRMHDANMSGIGRRVLSETESGERGERILSGYWEVASR
ncbi:MAG TPA: glycosyltransferase family A protein [Arenicellales bacterium]|nr:glycosyltransferase family A protein [Arenicellales bacterium]